MGGCHPRVDAAAQHDSAEQRGSSLVVARRTVTAPVGPVLCLHGFTGTPFDVEALARALESRGHLVATPTLPGHGGTVDDLAATTADEWLSAAGAGRARLPAP